MSQSPKQTETEETGTTHPEADNPPALADPSNTMLADESQTIHPEAGNPPFGGTMSHAGPALVFDSENSDADSAIGESINGSYSASLVSSVRNYRYENGRRYHAFREGSYYLPNDEPEQDRLDMLHHIFRLILDGALYRAPVAQGSHRLDRVLDLGTGTGLWAIEMAEEFANATITGTDLSPIQPGWVPPNCKFYVDDFESSWQFSPEEHFDYVHGRGLSGSVADWPELFAQAYQNLNPGGWLEMQEYQTWVFSDDDTILSAPWIKEWCEGIDEASQRFGKRLRMAQRVRQFILDAGFVDVQEEIYKVPIGPWAKGRKMKELGLFYRANILDAVESFSIALYTRVLGYSLEHAQLIMAGVKSELQDPKLHLYVNFHFIWARRPETP